jgi:hypothetical protein
MPMLSRLISTSWGLRLALSLRVLRWWWLLARWLAEATGGIKPGSSGIA